MAEKVYNWTDDPMISGVADCNTDVVNDCLMHLKYENTTDAIQNMYTTGQVETQTRGFVQLQQMRRSTFDLSKFTVVGSPTITDDGIASGFSNSNYLTINNDFIKANSWKIAYPISATQTNQAGILAIQTDTCMQIVFTPNTKTINYALSSNGTSWDIGSSSFASSQLDTSKDSLFIIEFTGSSYEMYFIQNGIKISGASITNSNKIYPSTKNLILGNNISLNSPINGSIDLKHFSITVDGKEVFSGNKTGLDVIKPDNYTVVGSPVISDDGVASEFSASNYLTKSSLGITPTKNWKIALRLQMPSYASSTYRMVTTIGNAKNPNRCYLRNTASNIKLFGIEFVGVASSSIILQQSFDANGVFKFSTWYDVEFGQELSNGVYKSFFKYKTIDADVFTEMSNTSATNFQNISQLITIGYWNTTEQAGAEGYNIDLNSFKIYVDGNLVYQPCLKIPYTQSKTDSKIVDVAYRDRVIDLYEQEGQAGYYTIDEENKNFTLPMGEIYGMIEEKAVQIDEVRKSKVDKSDLAEIYPVVKTYVNGTSGYRIWSDGYCVQWGRSTVNPDSSVTITFLKPFMDTSYYANWISCSGTNTSGSGTRSADTLTTTTMRLFNGQDVTMVANWQSCGYLAEGWNNEGI